MVVPRHGSRLSRMLGKCARFERAWPNGEALAFQASYKGSIPLVRSNYVTRFGGFLFGPSYEHTASL